MQRLTLVSSQTGRKSRASGVSSGVLGSGAVPPLLASPSASGRVVSKPTVVLVRMLVVVMQLVTGLSLAEWALTERALAQDLRAARAQLAGQAAEKASVQFAVPPGLRTRVDFWIDIFARHGRHEVVMHHRLYPQAIFARLDFRQEAETMSAVQLVRHRKDTIAALTERVLAAVRALSARDGPSNDFETRIERALRSVPGNAAEKYRAILEDPELVRTQTGIRERYSQAIKRSGRYLPSIEQIFVKEYGLPIELTRLPFVESSFDYQAYSSVGAAGIWQFMPRTGAYYLTINKYVDERRDPIRATHAAAAYLTTAFNSLGNWPLAVTSYNHGVAGVRRKVRAFGTTDIVQLIERPGDRPFGFASSNFYPSFLAAVEVWDRRDELFPDVQPEAAAKYRMETVGKATAVKKLAQIYGVGVKDLEDLNYSLTAAVWKGKIAVPAGFRLRVPMAARQRVAVIEPASAAGDGAKEVSAREFSGATYRVRKGDSLAGIAKRYRVPLASLLEANGNSEDIHVGQLMAIPRLLPTPKATVVYTVRPGDTLHAIAKRNKLSVGKIRELNKLTSTRLQVGQRLVIGQ